MSSVLLSYRQAAAAVAACAAQRADRRPPVERVELSASAGRVLAQVIRADEDQPPFSRSTRDGFACRAAEASSGEFLPVAGATRAGEPPAGPLPPNAAWEIMTGAPIPPGADCVVMIEHVEAAEGRVRLIAPRTVMAGENIVPRGAQGLKGDELLAPGTVMAFGQTALAASCGYSSLEVFARPRVAILTTGDELVPVQASPLPGQIRNSNAPMLASLVTAAGAEPWILPAAPDHAASLDGALTRAAQADLLLISGGVSAGRFDLVEPALARAGARFHFTGVRMQPGKPLVFGEMPGPEGLSLPFFGLPGNPVSSAVTFLLFAAPLLAALAGSRDPGPLFALARLSLDTDRRARPGLTRFLPARCDFNASTNELPHVAPLPWQGSGDLAALARSNCFLVVPEDTAWLAAAEVVRVLLA